MERALYARAFGLPTERFDFIRWAVSQPKVDQLGIPLQSGLYVAAIGGNGRDYHTLLNAARILPHIQFVLVVRPESIRELDVPSNVIAYQNLPPGLAMNVLFYSRFMVLPIADVGIPAGHVTLIAAMHLGKASIATDCPGLRDYVLDGQNALTIQIASVSDLVAKIDLLWQHHELCIELGESARCFAIRECTEDRVTQHFQNWLIGKGILLD